MIISKEITLTEEIDIKITGDKIWDNLTNDDFGFLKEKFYDIYKSEYIEWLVGEGLVEEVE